MKRLMMLLLLAGASVGVAGTPTDEIQALLTYVGRLDGVSFVRNGSGYAASAAEAHLRMKWEKQSSKIRTAEAFIALCGSRSSSSGERYVLRFKDGSERFCDDVLTEQLRVLRQKTSPAGEPATTPAPSRGGA